jgi:hypothetical protein
MVSLIPVGRVAAGSVSPQNLSHKEHRKMKNRSGAGEVVTAVAIICVCVEIGIAASVLSAREPALSASSEARRQSQSESRQGGTVATQHASGPFDVKVVPQGTPDKAEGSTLARMSLDKQYHGGLEATAKGEMLTAGTDVQGSAG